MRKVGKECKASLRIPLFFDIYIIFTLIVLCNDYLLTLIRKMDYRLGLFTSAAVVLSTIFIINKRAKISIYNFDVERKDIFICIVILMISFTKIVFPDNSYDINNYHLYFQEFLNRDFLREDFFPIRAVNAHYFILGDRMLYVFRHFLGYRMGTILNTIVPILMYFQLKEIFAKNNIVFGEKIDNSIIAVAVVVGLFSENVLWNIDMYTIDFLAIPFLIELMRIVFFSELYNPVYACLVAGLAIAVKISNAYFILPLAIYYLVKHRRNIRIYGIITAFFVASMTFALYLFISYKITGNPIFPYANSIFKSPYFSLTDDPSALSGLISRFGPETIVQYIFWPIYMIIHPERCNDMGIYTGRTLISILAIFIAILFRKKIQLNKEMYKLYFLWIYLYFLSIFVFEGYNRYVALMDILGGILTVIIICSLIKVKSKVCWIGIYKSLAGVLTCALLMQCMVLGQGYFLKNFEPAWRGNLFNDFGSFKKNFKLLFQDQKTEIPEEFIPGIDEWFVLNCDGSFAALMDSEVPIIGLSMAATNEKTEEILQQYISDASKKTVYSYMTTVGRRACMDVLEANNLKIDGMRTVATTFTDVTKPLTIVKLALSDKKLKYNEYTSYSLENKKIQLSPELKKSEWLVGFLPEASEWGSDGCIIKIYLLDDKNNKRLVFEKYIMPYEQFEKIDIPEEGYDDSMEMDVEIENLENHTYIGDGYELISITEMEND